jgi:carbamoyl-phosphate synthase small subunit
MTAPAFLVLADGTVYEGDPFGAETSAYGEVVFTTAMTGYQEMLTDPSFAGQLVVPTYPLIGNYGINAQDIESRRIQVAGFIVRGWSDAPSHGLSTATLHDYLAAQGVPGISGLDTRALTRRLRSHGVMMGALAIGISPVEALQRMHEGPDYGATDFVRRVTAEAPQAWDGKPGAVPPPPVDGKKRIVVADFGVKYNILRILQGHGCDVVTVPATTPAADVLALRPNGVLLSPGPGDPVHLDYAVDLVRKLGGSMPIMGICLGHQVVARAFGATTYKLKFGHRGANHPVREERTGAVHITAQNHGYAVDADSLPPELVVSHLSLNDGTVEGLRHRSLPILTIQYHSEASPGPHDNEYLFEEFLAMVDASRPGSPSMKEPHA